MEVVLAVRPYDSRDLEEQEASNDALFPIIKIGIGEGEAFFCYRHDSPETGIDGANLYWYARNNPINNIDPNGRQSISPMSLVYFLGRVLTATAVVDRGIKEIRKSACETP